MEQLTLLVATTDAHRREFLTAQLDADGHTVHETDHAAAAAAKLSTHAIDVMILGDLEQPADALGCCARYGPANTSASIPACRSSPSAPRTS